MKKSLFTLAAFVASLVLFTSHANAQANIDLPACGPSTQLADDISNNVTPTSRCFELRMYTVDPARVGTGDFNGGIDELHQRFREDEAAMFERHGAEVIGVWQDLQRPNTLIWMLAYRDLEHRADVWTKFANDPDWTALRTKYNVPLNAPQVFYMSNTDYSNLK